MTRSARRSLARAAGAGAALACAAALAAGHSLGTFHAWHAIRFDDKGHRACMMWSQPVDSSGKYDKRGQAFAFVTHRPAEQRRDKVSFEAGYPFEPASQIRVTIGSTTFELFADGSTAWTYGADDDRALVEAMRTGHEMIVVGRSKRGTETRDRYSLIGFSAAHDAIDAACKAR